MGTDLNEINVPHQTTNLGGGSSNLSGRASVFSHLASLKSCCYRVVSEAVTEIFCGKFHGATNCCMLTEAAL